MVTNRKNRNTSGKSEEAASQTIVPVKVEVERFDQRIKNVEKVVEMVKDVSGKAFQLGTEYLLKKTESEQCQQEFDDIQHKRGVYLLTFSVTVIFVLCMTALLENQVDLVKFFINSGLAIAAGTGIASLLRVGGNKRKKQDSD